MMAIADRVNQPVCVFESVSHSSNLPEKEVIHPSIRIQVRQELYAYHLRLALDMGGSPVGLIQIRGI